MQPSSQKHQFYDPSQKIKLWLAGTAAVVGICATHPSAVNAADLVFGAEVFNNNCAACHTGGNNVIDSQKTLRKEDLEKYLAGGYNIDAIVTQVTNGKNGMPAWAGRLSEDEIQAVAAYVYDQAQGEKW